MPHGRFLNEADEARFLATALVESRADYGRDAAIDGAARSVGISRWSFWSLFYGKRKTVGHSVLASLRRQYLALCERQIAHLMDEMREVEGCGDDAFRDIATEAARVVARLKEARDRSS